jgi:hypothetical protein
MEFGVYEVKQIIKGFCNTILGVIACSIPFILMGFAIGLIETYIK